MAKMDLNGDIEKDNIEKIFWCAMDMLSDDDKKLPQASHLINCGVFRLWDTFPMPHAYLWFSTHVKLFNKLYKASC